MNAATKALPPLLFEPSVGRVPPGIEVMEINEVRRKGRSWAGIDLSRIPRDALIAVVRKAMGDARNAERVVHSLSRMELAVAAVYARHGGSVDGDVIRLDLMARGLLEIVEERGPYHTLKKWKSNPIPALANSWVLISEHTERLGYHSSSYDPNPGPDRGFHRYSLHAEIVRLIKPAGPASWSIPPAKEAPRADTIMGRSAAEVALDLARVLAHVSGHGSVKVRKDGLLTVPGLRALEKAVTLDKGTDSGLPNPHGFYFELLRQMGAVRIQEGEASPDRAAVARLFGQPDAAQAHAWARGWLSTACWFDGYGTLAPHDPENFAPSMRTGRQCLAWMLGGLARAGDRWYDLIAFLEAIFAGLAHASFPMPDRALAWAPGFSVPEPIMPAWDAPRPSGPAEVQKLTELAQARRRALWFNHVGKWYANAVMVTLAALGLVERGRLGAGDSARLAFRLTALGRAVFGAPEVPLPPEPAEHRCLIVQPNFDAIAYLNEADARAAGFLGRIAESGTAHSGPIQTFRLTRTSVYQAEEGGLGHAQIVDFLQRRSQREPPANVLRALADWSGKREGLSLRAGVTLLGFPTTADRDAHLRNHPHDRACGERFAFADHPRHDIPGLLVSDHLLGCRRTWELDEEGRVRASQPMDLVQRARLRQIARPPASTSAATDWRLTADSMRQAAASGLKPGTVLGWLNDHLAGPAPPLMVAAIHAWLRVGGKRPVQMGDAILLRVPDVEPFAAIATSRRLRPFLLGRPGPGWLLVRKERREELAAVLEELGFTVLRELVHDEDSLDDPLLGTGSIA